MNLTTYSAAFKEEAVRKTLMRNLNVIGEMTA